MPSIEEALPIALSQGDPAGIGPDIALSSWARRSEDSVPPFLYIGDPSALAERARLLGIAAEFRECSPEEAVSVFGTDFPVYPLPCAEPVECGKPASANAASIIGAIETAVDFVRDRRASGVTTAPIAKSVLYDAGFGFPGHTEYLADLAERYIGQSVMPVMMIAGPELRTVPVTIHIPLKDVPGALTEEMVYRTAEITARDLNRYFGITNPRLAVSGLNPHAGESGALGLEDSAIVAPAIERLKANGIDAYGPLPADTMFHKQARETYDVAICMYHDQALIPAKALAFDDGVNVTLGLPFIRTSPDHGTAFSLAGTGKASPSSMIAALKMASTMALYRGRTDGRA